MAVDNLFALMPEMKTRGSYLTPEDFYWLIDTVELNEVFSFPQFLGLLPLASALIEPVL